MIAVYDEQALLSEAERACIEKAAEAALHAQKKRGKADVTAVDAPRMREVNGAMRGIPCVTDVLSFPAAARGEMPQDGFWGDILICPERAREQAKEYGHSTEREFAFLTIHGMLHLFGYDHETPEDEREMLAAQRMILERTGFVR